MNSETFRNRRKNFVRIFAFILCCCACVGPGWAATHSVTDLGDTGAPGQLRTLIDAATAGDTILIPAGTIVLTGAANEEGNASGDLDILKDLTIVGAGPELTILDGAGNDRIFDVKGVIIVISGVTMQNGNPDDGAGGGLLGHGTLSLIDVVVRDCIGSGGGGIFHSSGTMVVEGSTIRDNESIGLTANGGGILNFGTITVRHSTISGNKVNSTSASSLGGGIANIGTMDMINSTVSGNEATGVSGGGVFQGASAISLNLINVTITQNRINSNGGGYSWGGGVGIMGLPVNAVNTIISRNWTGTRRQRDDCAGELNSLGHNLIETTSDCTISGVLTGNILGRRARLHRLADYGGPTETHALHRRSPAIDAGDDTACPLTDQRGQARPQDGDGDSVPRCDMGAFERAVR